MSFGLFFIILFLILLLFGMPIGFLLGLVGIFLMWQSGLPSVLLTAPQRFFESINTFTFLAMPFFLLCGLVMTKIGITKKLLAFSDLLVGRTTGGIGNVNVVASLLFGGISGSSLADIMGLGSIEIPMMVEAGYDPEYSTGITVSSAILSVIIPPSINLVIYGAVMNVSIGGLFAAGIPAGILAAILMMIVNVVISKKKNYPRRKYRIDKKVAFKIIKESVPALFLPIIIIGGMFGGIVTPTEAGAIAAAYSFFLGFVVYRNISLRDTLSIFIQMAKFCSIILLIVGAAAILGWYISMAKISDQIGIMLNSISNNPYIIMFIVNILLLLIGMFMDAMAAMLILSPILAPILINLGWHPLHVGLIICVNLSLGMITPPFGTGIFSGCMVGNVKYENLIRSMFPLVCVNIIMLFIIAYFPIVTMFFPKIFGYY